MSEDLEELKRGYRKISAPPYLATRICAEVADQPPAKSHWMPIATTTLAVAAIVWVLPFALQQPAQSTAKPTKPSLSALAALKPDKPKRATPTLSQLKSVSIPAAPVRPKPRTTVPRSETGTEFENELLEETKNVYI